MAARLRGERSAFVMAREILPNITQPIIVEGTVRLGYAVFTAATLAFLGFGLAPPSPDWGLTIATERDLPADRAVDGHVPRGRPGVARRGHQPHHRRTGEDVLQMSTTENQQPAGDAAALDVRDLEVTFHRRGRRLPVLKGVTLKIERGEAYGLVGESGCGKTTLAMAAMRYLAANGTLDNGRVLVDGQDVSELSEEALRKWRGGKVAMVYQDPTQALSPAMKIGAQLAEVYHYHEGLDKKAALGEGAREPAPRRHPGPRRDAAPLPVRAVGRPAAARRHRDGAGREPAAAHPRRAHHRPRRDGRGRDPRPHRGAARAHQRRHPAHHAQPRPGRAPLRAGRRAVRRPARRRGAGQGRLHRPAAPVHHGPAALRAALRHEQDRRGAADHPRYAAGARRSSRGLRLLGALSHGAAGLQAPRAGLLRLAQRRTRQGPGRGRGHAARPRRVLAAPRRAGRRLGPARALLLLRRRRPTCRT